MVKKINKINKLNKGSKSKKQKSKSRSMKGGDGSGGRVALPPAYYGNGLNGYYATGSPELIDNKQLAVSQGTLWSNGNMAGPNLFPMKGGNCNYRKQKQSKNKLSSKRKYMKNKKTKKTKKTNKK